MKKSVTATTTGGRNWRRIAAVVAGCLLVGGTIAFATRPQPLLTGAGDGPARMETVWAQLYHAKMVDTEAAWLAVGELFPTADDFCKNLAAQGLAQHYLSRQEWVKAIRPLRDLASLGTTHPSLSAFGIAGLVVAEASLGHLDEARNQNSRLTNEQRDLLRARAPQLYDLLDETRTRLDGVAAPNS